MEERRENWREVRPPLRTYTWGSDSQLSERDCCTALIWLQLRILLYFVYMNYRAAVQTNSAACRRGVRDSCAVRLVQP